MTTAVSTSSRQSLLVLGIESSCDETAVALYHTQKGLLAHNLYSQVELHAQYGGVVPELASRDHIQKLTPLILQTMQEANVAGKDIQGIAYTAGPGLMGALLTGASVARSLAYAWQIPPSACIIWKATCSRRCWKTLNRNFRLSACWCPAATV